MSRILCIWELGEDLGHLGRFAPVAEELIRRGHDVVLAAKDLSRVEELFAGSRVQLLQAPVWLGRLRQRPLTKCLADILLYKGYRSAESLRPMVRAWHSLFELVQPDLVVYDYAPTALLASRGMSIPRVILANGHYSPVPGQPLMDMCPWVPSKEGKIEESENRVVEVINKVADDLQLPPVRYVSDLFEVHSTILSEIQGFDIYAAKRQQAYYSGPLIVDAGLMEPVWAREEGPKIFAYLKPGREKVEEVLDSLSYLGVNVLCYCPDYPPSYHKYMSPNFLIGRKPYRLRSALEQADVVICHSNIGMVSASLYFGRPLLVLPTQLEQNINAIKIEDVGAGIWIKPQDDAVVIIRKINSLLTDSGFGKNAQTVAQHNRHVVLDRICPAVCDEIESQLLS
jgi:UDP:flavonoid glycosyltransferase YjiC (YdhE family)